MTDDGSLLVLEPYPEVNRQFAAEEGIEVIQLGMPNNKDPLAQSASSPADPPLT